MATTANQPDVVETVRPDGAGPVVLICEHASSHIPAVYANLGLAPEDRLSHAVWDPGAEAMAQAMSVALDAPLVAGRVSRLVFDCNRPASAEQATTERSEMIVVPGNQGLTPAQRAARAAAVAVPFDAAVSKALDRIPAPVLVTIHSFTPTYFGKARPVEVGILHDTDSRMADAMLGRAAALAGHKVARNAPYGPEDGVTHTLKVHGLARGIPNVMIEVRNDLLTSQTAIAQMADALSNMVALALNDMHHYGTDGVQNA